MVYIVDGKTLTEEDFIKLHEEIQKNPNFKLVLIEGKVNEFKTLQRLLG